ncbi:MAG: hypothetical protein Q7S76_02875, partial [bacterium]|nr:hypothetical protein [bacterium]
MNRKGVILAILISIFFSIVNSLHVFVGWILTPRDSVFMGIAHYPADYFLYLSTIAQRSVWYRPSFSNEPMVNIWIYWFNGFLGFVGSLVNASPQLTYNVSLFFLSIVLGILWYVLLRRVFPNGVRGPLLGLCIVLSASNFSISLGFKQLARDFWFSPTPAFNRLGGVPHQIFQTILLISLLLVFQKALLFVTSIKFRREKASIFPFLRNFVGLCILTILSSTANPIQMTLLLGASVLTTIITSLRTKRTSAFLPLILLMSVAAVSILATNGAFTHPILAQAKAWENAQRIRVSVIDLILAMGPIVFLIPFGAVSFLKKQTPIRTLLLFYGALSFGVFFSPIPAYTGTASVRWLHPASYVLFPILATEGVGFLTHNFTRKLKILLIGLVY